jgi:hypothetical protein
MTTGPPPKILTIYLFRSQFIPNLTNFLLIPVGMYMYSITYPLTLITSPAAILNLPINSFCLLDTALVLTFVITIRDFLEPSLRGRKGEMCKGKVQNYRWLLLMNSKEVS